MQRGDNCQQQYPFTKQPAEDGTVCRSMRFVQCYLRTALLRTEPECSEQAEENVQQQESHTHHIVTDVIGPCLLVVATNILERTYLRNEDIAYAELALTVCLQPLNEVIVLPFTDADTKFETDIVETLLHHHGI